LRSEHRLDSLLSREAIFLLNNLALVGLCFVILWGTFFPLLSEAVTGDRASVGPPWFSRYTVPLALLLVLLSGLGPVMAWRRTTVANLRQALALPALAALVTFVVLMAAGSVAGRPLALILFCFAAFTIAVVVQEFWRGVRARRAMSEDSIPLAIVSLVRRNRRRYGGYLVHAGVALLLVGVAASSTFQDARDVKLAPGERARVGSYDVEYVRPTGKLDIASGGSLEKINLGADLRVRRNGGDPKRIHTERSYFPSSDPSLGAVSRYFEGEATSEVGLEAGFRRDFWATVAPDTRPLRRIIRRGDRVFAMAAALPADQRAAALGEALRRLAAAYPASAPPATFRILVSPLVTWIWLGALIVFAGGLIAIWPLPAGATRRATAARAARLARELGRA
jgi:cytochrome c-type biogenesis protein CcmF